MCDTFPAPGLCARSLFLLHFILICLSVLELNILGYCQAATGPVIVAVAKPVAVPKLLPAMREALTVEEPESVTPELMNAMSAAAKAAPPPPHVIGAATATAEADAAATAKAAPPAPAVVDIE